MPSPGTPTAIPVASDEAQITGQSTAETVRALEELFGKISR